MRIIIGNAISLLGCIVMVAIGFIKKKKRVLAAQCAQFAIQGIANLTLGGVSGFISNVVGIARNLVFFKTAGTWWLKLLFILIQAVLSFAFDGFGLLVWLPILSAVIFTWFIDVKSEVAFKVVMIVGQLLWLAYDLCYLNFVGVAFDSFSTIANLIALVSMVRNRSR